jgi:hypothetical protein
MHLLEGIPIEVYNAYFPTSVVDSCKLTSNATRLFPRPNYFPQGLGVVCAEDPQCYVAGANGSTKGYEIFFPIKSLRCGQG